MCSDMFRCAIMHLDVFGLARQILQSLKQFGVMFHWAQMRLLVEQLGDAAGGAAGFVAASQKAMIVTVLPTTGTIKIWNSLK